MILEILLGILFAPFALIAFCFLLKYIIVILVLLMLLPIFICLLPVILLACIFGDWEIRR